MAESVFIKQIQKQANSKIAVQEHYHHITWS